MRDKSDKILENLSQKPSMRSWRRGPASTKRQKWGSSGATLCIRPWCNYAVCAIRSLPQLLLYPFIFSSFCITYGIILLVGSIQFYLFSDLTRQNNETPGVANWMTPGFGKPAHPRSADRVDGFQLHVYSFISIWSHWPATSTPG